MLLKRRPDRLNCPVMSVWHRHAITEDVAMQED